MDDSLEEHQQILIYSTLHAGSKKSMFEPDDLLFTTRWRSHAQFLPSNLTQCCTSKKNDCQMLLQSGAVLSLQQTCVQPCAGFGHVKEEPMVLCEQKTTWNCIHHFDMSVICCHGRGKLMKDKQRMTAWKSIWTSRFVVTMSFQTASSCMCRKTKLLIIGNPFPGLDPLHLKTSHSQNTKVHCFWKLCPWQ